MKLAITAEGNSPDSPVDPRLGRAKWFMIYDSDSETYEAVDNSSGVEATHGAGPIAAETIAAHKVDCVITGHCGPRAYQALNAAGIKVAVSVEGTVAESVSSFLAGELKSTDGPDVQGHWT
ncbi:MAG TPA: NifB/NifX family molybdenum-iron cluster-binding protein [Acidobacteriota bacterium]|nr:NifB/NifX family molybdenum-iron cluster-binding protein [Acidobacteriota bacterium]